MTGSTTVMACHIIPHAKGYQVCSEYFSNHPQPSFQAKYIENLASYRPKVLDPPLDSIDDTCNGILLNPHLHIVFGASVHFCLLVILTRFSPCHLINL